MSKRGDSSYDVGYGKPPKAHRFKAGRSGNARGRPRPPPELSDLMSKELKRKRIIVEDGERLSLPMVEILIKRLIDLGVKGRLAALMHIFAIADQHAEKQRETAAQNRVTEISASTSLVEAARLYAETLGHTSHVAKTKK